MAQSFTPTRDNERAFRTVLGQFATGVTVITVATEKGPVGMTANSFSALSLDPPLIMWAPAKSAHRFECFTGATHFAVHILLQDQEDIAMDFARNAGPFEALGAHKNAHGVPIFDRCLARLECRTHAIHDGGDHAIVVGQVERAMQENGAPLIFAQSGFGGFLPAS